LRMMLEMKHRIEKNKRILSASCPLIKSNHSTSPPSLSVQGRGIDIAGRLHDGVHLDDENSAEDSTEDVPNDKNGSVDSSSCTPKKTNDGESSSYIFRSTLDCIKQELSALTEVRSRISLQSNSPQCNVSPPTTSVSPPQSQMNVIPIGVDKYLSGGFIKWCKRIEWIVDESELVAKMVQNSANCSFGSILLTGAPCTGKSCLSAVIAKGISKKGIRLLSGDDIIG
uniref:ATPase_AAA_core domain-containing protein n=1 Tax=Anisakis simplex TaxID=6269 RepID=A0A0M3J4J4_ANISI